MKSLLLPGKPYMHVGRIAVKLDPGLSYTTSNIKEGMAPITESLRTLRHGPHKGVSMVVLS